MQDINNNGISVNDNDIFLFQPKVSVTRFRPFCFQAPRAATRLLF
jgi:hypothetical protein